MKAGTDSQYGGMFKKYYDKGTGEYSWRGEEITEDRRTTWGKLRGAKPTEVEMREKEEKDREKEVKELLKTKTPTALRKQLDAEYQILRGKLNATDSKSPEYATIDAALTKNLNQNVALGKLMEKGGRRKSKKPKRSRRTTRRR